MNQDILMQIAVHLLEVWLLSLGLQPTGDFDPNDPACMCDYGPHRVYTVQAHIPDGFDVDPQILFDYLQKFLNKQAALPGAIRFNAYNIDLYHSPYCGGYVFASIEHTA